MNILMKKTAAAVLSAAMAVTATAAAGVSASAANNVFILGDLQYAETDTEACVLTCSPTVTNLTIPASVHGKPVTAISTYAFAGNTNLVSITIDADITILPYAVAAGCTNLQSVRLPNGLKHIYPAAFSGCTSLKTVDLPYSTEYVYYNAFGGCTGLEKLIVRSSNTILNYNAFRSDSTGVNTPFYGKVYCYTESYAGYWANNLNYSKQTFSLGDVNEDNRVNAADASAILGYYAAVSTGSLTQNQIDTFSVAGDVNRDGRVNAVDASAVLAYYAARSTGRTALSMEEYMATEY